MQKGRKALFTQTKTNMKKHFKNYNIMDGWRPRQRLKTIDTDMHNKIVIAVTVSLLLMALAIK